MHHINYYSLSAILKCSYRLLVYLLTDLFIYWLSEQKLVKTDDLFVDVYQKLQNFTSCFYNKIIIRLYSL